MLQVQVKQRARGTSWGKNGLKKLVYATASNQLIFSNEQTPSPNFWKPLTDIQYTNTVAAFGNSSVSIVSKSIGAINVLLWQEMWLPVEKELPRLFYIQLCCCHHTNQ